MGAYSYCHKCETPLGAPEVRDFVYGEPTCSGCGAERLHNNFAEAVLDAFESMRVEIDALKEQVARISGDGK